MLRLCSLRQRAAVCQDKNNDFLKKFFHFLEFACSNDTALKVARENHEQGVAGAVGQVLKRPGAYR
jgi:hypothetical protein